MLGILFRRLYTIGQHVSLTLVAQKKSASARSRDRIPLLDFNKNKSVAAHSLGRNFIDSNDQSQGAGYFKFPITM